MVAPSRAGSPAHNAAFANVHPRRALAGTAHAMTYLPPAARFLLWTACSMAPQHRRAVRLGSLLGRLGQARSRRRGDDAVRAAIVARGDGVGAATAFAAATAFWLGGDRGAVCASRGNGVSPALCSDARLGSCLLALQQARALLRRLGTLVCQCALAGARAHRCPYISSSLAHGSIRA